MHTSQPLSRLWALLSPVARPACPPHRALSVPSGLLSILSEHGKKQKTIVRRQERSDEASATELGILGSIARQNGTKPKPRTRASQSFTRTGGQASPKLPEGETLPKETVLPNGETQSGLGSGVRYDDRWARLLDKSHQNGKNRHQSQGRLTETPSQKVEQRPAKKVQQRTITISDDITPKLLAHKLGVTATQLEHVLTSLGETPESNEDTISVDAAELAAGEFNVLVKKIQSNRQGESHTVMRPPVVTVMGHVDHGKTTLLDALRHSSVAAQEAGGITQHIGAFEVQLEGSEESLTFLDTPGHSAFSSMRARGAQITDLVVLVVAADDGVMPQTRESLKLVREAGCQFVVAVTKCDLPQADLEKVKSQLGAESVELEDFGGSVQLVPVSAPTRQGLEELQEALLLQATTVDLKARPDIPATGVVVEANKTKGMGPVATVIITEGTLRVGQPVVVGHHWGRIRQLKTPLSHEVEEVRPGKPVEISGLRSVPQPGDELMVVCSEDRAKRVSAARLQRCGWTPYAGSHSSHSSDERAIPFLIKSDTQGTGEAVVKAVEGLASEVIAPEVVGHAVGDVSEADVMFAEATCAQILAFNVKPLGHEVLTLVQHKNVTVHQSTVIYELLDIVGNALLENAPMCEEEEVIGQAAVQKIFNIRCKKSKSTLSVAGCLVTSGHVQKSNTLFRLLRSDKALFQGACASLKRHKLDVDRVGKGTECGIMLDSFHQISEGDVIQTVLKKKRRPKTESVVGGGLRVVESSNTS